MSTIDVRVPDIGGSTDVDVIELCVAAGDSLEVDEPMIVVESDKATMEIPATVSGQVVEVKVAIGDKVSEGDLILTLREDAGAKTQETIQTDSADVAPESAKNPVSEGIVSGDIASQDIVSASSQEEPRPTTEATSTTTALVNVPDIGSDSAAVIEICVSEGDEVAKEDSLVVLESDKATMEVPSTVAGKITKILLKVGDEVSEGAAIVEVESESTAPAVSREAAPTAASPPQVEKKTDSPAKSEAAKSGSMYQATPSDSKVHAGPAVRKLAREFGVDLSLVTGSGPKQRILKEDVQGFVKQRLKQSPTASAGSGIPSVKLPDFSQFGEVERRSMSKIHQVTAENMQRAWLNVPHVTQFDEADITALEEFRKSKKALAESKGTRLTPLPFLLKACAHAIKAMPQFNVSLDIESREVIQKRYIHIGVAVDTPDGLVVPVIRNVDKKSLWELATETLSLADKAKNKKLTPAEMQGGCFTISSLGSVGGTAFTPIVNTPEVAILGVSKASIKPVYLDGEFVPRLMLPLSLSYDHRAVNGADAARFTNLLADLLGDIRNMLL